MSNAPNVLDTVLDAREAELAKIAQRCLMMTLDHSRAPRLKLISEAGINEDMPALELPPKVLRMFAEMLGAMARQQPVTLLPQKLELTTQDAAAFLNVSRPFVVKQLEAGKIPFRKVGRHRRVYFEDLVRFERSMREETGEALQELADQAQELGMGY